MIGEVNSVSMPEQFLRGLHRVGTRAESGVLYEFFIDATTLLPVIYRKDRNVFWHISLNEMLCLAQAAGIDGGIAQ